MEIKNHLFCTFSLLFALTVFAAFTSINAQTKTDSEILITIERGPCFGPCPVYSAKIYNDGTVVYEGAEFVRVNGIKQHKITVDKVKELIKAFEQIRYFSLKDRYDADENGMSMTDQPTTTTSISLNGKQKKVVNYYGAPKQLGELENLIDSVASLYEYIVPI